MTEPSNADLHGLIQSRVSYREFRSLVAMAFAAASIASGVFTWAIAGIQAQAERSADAIVDRLEQHHDSPWHYEAGAKIAEIEAIRVQLAAVSTELTGVRREQERQQELVDRLEVLHPGVGAIPLRPYVPEN